MLRAVVFDDEFIVLKGLTKLIDWSEHGIELAATAADGLSALQVFREVKPDIVMTDIRMPGMDGLHLIELILAEAPETMCIVFSGYNEYEYVKRAISLGVVDYLEKPVTLAKIKEGVQKAVARIAQLQEASSLKLKWQQGLLEKATLDLLLLGGQAVGAWREQFGSDDARVTGVTVLASSESAFKLSEGTGYQVVRVRNGAEYVTVVFQLDLFPQDWTQSVQSWTGRAIGSGRTYEKLEEASLSYKEALKALRYGDYLEGTGWTRFEDLEEGGRVAPYLSEREEEVIFDMRIGNKEGLLGKLNVFLEQFKKEKPDPEVAENEFLKMVYLGLEVAKETGGNLRELKPYGYLPQRELRELRTIDDMASWLKEQMGMMMDWIISVRQKSMHSAVEKAIAYIDMYYGRDLSQQEVADHVEMNATYFSLLFKEQMGISYIKYITKIRMEKAKALLMEGISIHQISELVGYYHSRHFSEVFKKQTGMTPGQYRSWQDKQAGSKKTE